MRSNKIIPNSIFLFSLLFHVTVYYTLFSKNEPFLKYPNFALQHINSSVNPERLIDFSPLYLSIHIFAQRFLSFPNEAILWLQLFLIAGSAVLLFVFLRSFFKSWIALAGAVLFTTNRSIVVYSCVFEPEVFTIFFLLCFLVCVIRKSLLSAFASGVFFALVLLLRLNFSPVALIVPLCFYLNGERKHILMQRSILFIFPVIISITLLSLKNHALTNTLSPIVMNPGYVSYCGNNPIANGRYGVFLPLAEIVAKEIPYEVDREHIVYRLFPRRISGKQLSVSEVNSYWKGKMGNFIADHPISWCRLLTRKLYSVFHAVRWHDIDQVIANDRGLQKNMIPAIPFGLISSLALIGLFRSLRTWRKNLFFYAVFICQISVMMMTFSSDRQRISILALFIFFAAFTLNDITSKNISKQHRVIVSIIILILSACFTIKTDSIKDDLHLRDRIGQAQKMIVQAQKYRKEGRLAEASEKNARAKAFLPYLLESRLSGLTFEKQSYPERALAIAESLPIKKSDFSSRFDLALLYLENGRLADAETILKGLIRNNHKFSRISAHSSQPQFYLAKAYELQGRHSESISRLQVALSINPGDPWVLSQLAVLSNDVNYKNQIVRYYDEIDAEYFMGLAYLENGRIEEALASFSYLIEKVPEYREGLIYTCIALGSKGNFEQAAQQYIRAMEKKVDPLFKEKEILDIFNAWVELNPRSIEPQYYLGLVLKDFGHYGKALETLQKVLQKKPSLTTVKKEIDWLKKAAHSLVL